jgi:lactate dehydrogenase-like 2-hydroxyacid dehydrogenase
MVKIISVDILPQECKKILSNHIILERFSEKDLEEAEALLIWPSLLDYNLISKMKKLKVIQTYSAGVDDLNFNIIPESVIILSNAGAYSRSVAEHAWAIAFTLAKGVGLRKKVDIRMISNKTVLILGAGGIGSEIASIGKYGFKTYNIGVSRTFKNKDVFDEMHQDISAIDNLIPRADFIFDTLPLNKFTKNILNYERLKKAKYGAIIVNVGRGETVDEEGLYKILKERRDLRFGTDVFWRRNGMEDFNTKLWELENFTGTLHTGGAYGNEEVKKNAMIQACLNLQQYLDFGKINNLVRREDYI